jgi:hypothetical protein
MSAPTDQAKAAASTLSASLVALRSAVQTFRAAGDEASLSELRGRLDDFESSLRTLRGQVEGD